jgi:LysM repeat protein
MISLKSLLTEGTGLLKDSYIDKGLSLANALIRRGFTKDQAAAIVGNIWAECTFDHTETGSGGDFGLLQWLGPRKKALQEFANNRKSSIMNLTTQLDFIKYELLDEYDGEYAYETTMFRRAMAYGDSIRDKAEGFARYSERPKKAALAASLPTRKKVAQQIYDLLTGKKRDKWGRLETSKWYGFNSDTKRYETGPNTGKSYVATKKTYTVKSGDSLSVIASKYKTTVDSLKRANNLKSDVIKPGQKLIIK